MQARITRIGTRGSALALAQAYEVRAKLMAAHNLPEASFEIVVIKTSGDTILDRPLSEAGGKGLFTKEIEEALLSDTIDLAVHSMKDMQTVLPSGLCIGAMLEREDVRDAFISLKFKSLGEMPKGSRLGTSSLRRQAQVKRLRPDIEVVGFRGNVQTRLNKLKDGAADATLLACAGLKRLGLAREITEQIEISKMIPAVAQGAIGIEVRDDDIATAEFIAPLDHAETKLCVTAERAFLARLEGSCRTPIAGHATLARGSLTLAGEILTPDGMQALSTRQSAPAAQALELGRRVAEDLIARAGPELMAMLPSA